MEPEKTKSKIPLWVWLLASVALLMLCALVVTGALGLGVFSLFTTTAPESSADIVLAEPIEVVGSDQETEQQLAELQATNTAAAEPDSQEPDETADSDESPATIEPQASETAGDEGSGERNPPVNDPGAAERATIEANVVEIRQLQPLAPVDPTLLSSSELGQRLEDEFAENYSPAEARNDAIALSAFDFIEADFDIYNFLISLYTEQIAGFYDPETDEFVIIDNDDEFDVP